MADNFENLAISPADRIQEMRERIFRAHLTDAEIRVGMTFSSDNDLLAVESGRVVYPHYVGELAQYDPTIGDAYSWSPTTEEDL